MTGRLVGTGKIYFFICALQKFTVFFTEEEITVTLTDDALTQEITSPGYPLPYPSNSTFTWLLVAPSDSVNLTY